MRLHSTASFYDVPLVAMRVIRYLVGLLFTVWFLGIVYGSTVGWIAGVVFFVCVILFSSTRLMNRYDQMERKFMNNLNMRENTRLGTNNNLVSDMHQAYIEVGPYCNFVGDRIQDSGLRSDYGVSVSSIQRGERLMPLPPKEMRIFPGDILGVIGTDDQIKRLNDDIEREAAAARSLKTYQPVVELHSVRLAPTSPIINRPLAETDLRHDFYSMIVKIQTADGEFVQPEADTVLKAGDIVWLVGDVSEFDKIKGV